MWSPVFEGPNVRVVVFGGTGYIGRAVVQELAARGHSVVVVSREVSGAGGKNSLTEVSASFKDCRNVTVVAGDVQDASSMKQLVHSLQAQAAVCCLASRTGGRKDSWDIDYQATVNCMQACNAAPSFQHFILLSAVCVQRPLLVFQEAKLKAELELQRLSSERSELPMKYSIVQPTAYFKSLLGQVKRVNSGAPFVMFGDGTASCKPISEQDLAAFISDCLWDPERQNKVLQVGGPPPALSFKDMGQIMFTLTKRDPYYFSVPFGVFDFIQGILDFGAKLLPQMEDAAEYGRIGRYYAEQSMLVLDPATGQYSPKLTPSYGTTTLKDCLVEALSDESKLKAQDLGQQAFTERLGVMGSSIKVE